MKEKSRAGFHIIQVMMIALAAILLLALFLLTGVSENVKITETRSAEGSIQIKNFICEEYAQADAPVGVMEEYRFVIPENLLHDTSLNFYLVHQYAQVYLDGECIYRLEVSEDLPVIKTPGCNWATVPIYHEDAGKEVCVRVTPVYKDVCSRTIDFRLGPKDALILKQMDKDWMSFVICELLMLSGLVLIGFSIYYIHVYERGSEIIAFGIMSICLGLWRYFDTRFAPFMVPEKPVLLFYLSTGAMMFGMIPLMLSQRGKVHKAVLNGYTLIVACLCVISAVLQFLGIADIREFLPLFHITAIAGLLIMLTSKIRNRKKKCRILDLETVSLILMVIGALLDAMLYYFRNSSTTIVFFPMAILFYILVTVFTHMVHYGRQEQILANQETQIIQSKVTAMMGQIRSHFVFNILNAISGMCKYDPEKADRTVVCFARYLRTNIDIMQDDQPVPFQTALEHLEDYIELEKIRFGDKICLEKQIGTDRFLIPALVLQPLVENSIRHGLIPKPEGGLITLRTWVENGKVRISIQDTGVGFDVNAVRGKAVGISNVRFRLQYMVNGRLIIESTPGCGTTATITLPPSALEAKTQEE